MGVIVRTSVGPDKATVATLARAGVATVHEAMGRAGLLASYLRPIYPGGCVAGRAVTVLSQPGDNLMIHAAIEQCRSGDLLVVATMSPSTDGMFGELLATSLRVRGVVGLIIDAGARDVAALREMRFPVWSRAVSAQGTVKATAGSVNVPVTIGGQYVRPGDVVIADDDGVVVVPLADSQRIATASVARLEAEAAIRADLRAGTLTVDSMGLRARLDSLGVTYVDAPPGSPVADSA
jgi:4-hydroxy-4-methyl-2-oxoglutarate aldolase